MGLRSVSLANFWHFLLGFALAFCIWVSPQLAMAGPWQPQKGSGFVSLSGYYTKRLPDIFGYGAGTDRYVSVYAEYALRPKLTLGLDAGYDLDGRYRVFFFTQKPIRQADQGVQITFATGGGMIDATSWTITRLSLGKGLANGWMSAEGQLLFQNPDGTVEMDDLPYEWKLDLTLGRNLKKGRKRIVQLQTSRAFEQDLQIKLAPSFVFPLVQDRMHLEAGGSFGLKGDKSRGVKLAIWYTF